MVNPLYGFSAVIMPSQNKLLLCLIYLGLLHLVSCKITLHICGEPIAKQFFRYGNDLELCCSLDGEKGVTADDLAISFGGDKQSSEKLDQKTRKALISQPDVGRYEYFCNFNLNKTPVTKIVYVTNPPSEVSDFKCFSDNLETLNCTWNRPENDISDYKLYYTLGGQRAPVKVENGISATMYYAFWREIDLKNKYRNNEPTFDFTLIASNEFGVLEKNIIIDHYSIVKPKPPTRVWVDGITPHGAIVNWELDRHMFFVKQVKYKIEYHIQIPGLNNTNYTVSKFTENRKVSSVKQKDKFVLSNLPYANAEYKVRVYVKTVRAKDEFWSNPQEANFTTTSERPRPPQVIAGAFEQQVYGNRRIVHVYWTPLQEYEKSGKNFEYLVNVESSTYKNQNTTTVGHLKLENNPLDALEVLLWSKNDAGASFDNSYLYVPSAQNVNNMLIKSFSTLSYGNGTYELMWLNRDTVDNYTIFWCTQDSNGICTNGVNFIHLAAPKKFYATDLPSKYSYRFAISANKGYKSSGMTWATGCELSAENLDRSNFQITLNSFGNGRSYVNLTWSLNCLYKDGVITGYNISYCHITRYGECSYIQPIPSWKYIDDPNITKTDITGLRPFTKYIFEINANTSVVGQKSGNYTIPITTNEDTPTYPSNINIPKDKITNNSVTITLQPPAHLNGPITNIRFVVYNNDKEIKNTKAVCDETTCEDIILENLDSYTEYSLSVKSYNEHIDSFSIATVKEKVKTKIGAPGVIDRVTYSNAENTLSWQRPLKEGGNLDYYEIKLCENCDGENIVQTPYQHFIDNADCEDRVYYVRGVNKAENGILHHGPWSAPSNVSCNNNTWKRPLYITALTLLSLILLYLLFKLYKKIADAESIRRVKPKFPDSLNPDKENKTDKPGSPMEPRLNNDKMSVSNSLYGSLTRNNKQYSQKGNEKLISLKLPKYLLGRQETNLPVDPVLSQPFSVQISTNKIPMEFNPSKISSGDVQARPALRDPVFITGNSQNSSKMFIEPSHSIDLNTTASGPNTVNSSSGSLLTKIPVGCDKAKPFDIGYLSPGTLLTCKRRIQPNNPKLSSDHVQAEPIGTSTATSQKIAENTNRCFSRMPIGDFPVGSGATYNARSECIKPTKEPISNNSPPYVFASLNPTTCTRLPCSSSFNNKESYNAESEHECLLPTKKPISNTSSPYVKTHLNPTDGAMSIDETRLLRPSSYNNKKADIQSEKPSDEANFAEILEVSASVAKNPMPDASENVTSEFVSPEDKLISIRSERTTPTDATLSPHYSKLSLL